MKRTMLTIIVLLPILGICQTWTQLNPLPSTYDARNHPVTFALNGDGYVLTGGDDTTEFKDFYKYTVATDSWEKLIDFPGNARGFAYGVTENNKAYVGFGSYFDASNSQFVYLKDLWEYDPSNGNWTQLADLPGTGRNHPAMVATAGKIFVGLGNDATGDLKDWWEYDISSNTWVAKPDLPNTQRHHPYYFSINNIAYVGFGHHGSSIFKDFYKYEPATSTWTRMADFPDQGRVAGTQFSYNGKGYILSGQGENHSNLPIGEFWEYDEGSDQWTQLTAHPGGGRWAPGSFVIGDELFLTSGRTNSGDQKDLMKYTFEALSINDIAQTEPVFVYPNPVQNTLQIEVPLSYGKLRLSTISGQQLDLNFGRTSKGFKVDLAGLSTGVYLLQMETSEKGLYFKRIVKQ